MRLPDFVLVGVRKCGTTWLHQCLSEHPAIFLPASAKELFYFDTYWHRGVEWYARHFRDCDPSKICGDIAPSCFASAEAATRIRSTIPRPRLVFIFRDPVDRVVSLYDHMHSHGEMPLSLADAIARYPDLLEEGFYARHFAHYRELFGTKDVLPLLLEEVRKPETGGLAPLFRFLGVDDRFEPPSLRKRVYAGRQARSQLAARMASAISHKLHQAGFHGVVRLARQVQVDRLVLRRLPQRRDPVSPAVVARLRSIYHHEVEELGRMLERDLPSIWGYTSQAPAATRKQPA